MRVEITWNTGTASMVTPFETPLQTANTTSGTFATGTRNIQTTSPDVVDGAKGAIAVLTAIDYAISNVFLNTVMVQVSDVSLSRVLRSSD